MKSFVFFSILFLQISVLAYIPRTSMIISRMAENTGSGIYQIEQEVQFPNGSDTVTVKETWLIENENSMRLSAVGGKDLKDLFSFQATYTGGNRQQNGQSKRVGEDFIEKYFHIRSADAYAQALISLKLVPSNVMAKKPVRGIKEVDYQPESFIQLGRVGGVIAYAITPVADSAALKPGFWIEQDQFLIRKFRLPSMVEVSADRYSPYARGLSFPGTRTVKWDNNQVTIQTLSVKGVGKEAIVNFNKNLPNKSNLGQVSASAVIEDFYKRLR